MTGTFVKMVGAAALVAGVAFGSTASRAAEFATSAPFDGIVASDADAGSLLRKVRFGCGPAYCGWHPGYFGPRFGYWRPAPVVRCGPYHCWRRILDAGHATASSESA
ncbi:MAG: hypothetical protein ACHQAY_01765 [Hyphomicrobiales bacterium]